MNPAPLLARARVFANRGDFARVLHTCTKLLERYPNDSRLPLDVGVLLLNAGFLGAARDAFLIRLAHSPEDISATLNLANVEREAGRHAQARALYDTLLQRYPDHAVLRRNALVSLEYDATASEPERFAMACEWGRWAQHRAQRPDRPALKPVAGRPLRVGYVSADLCQHTVGLLSQHVLISHDPARVQACAYHAGQIKDWVTDEIARHLPLRDVSRMEDDALAAQIRADEIDVLVDMSGHTAGSRLAVFAHRPAPVQVSWLGYFATTGLDSIDAVLLDEIHAPPGTEAQFVERIIHLPGGRWCYQPLPFAPEVAPLPADRLGRITFGSFNNTAKYHTDVHALWASILLAIPDSRLILKWRTFNDLSLRDSVLNEYTKRGISPVRIALHGPSFHEDVLKSYAEIDIALDPFPFTGGLTSCEALWMGVPVVTLPQARVVSRQTASFLNNIGLQALIASDETHYRDICIRLASDLGQLRSLRQDLRSRMQSSPLMDTRRFVQQLETAYVDLCSMVSAQ